MHKLLLDAVLRRTLQLVHLPDNNFIWSGWDSPEDAEREIRRAFSANATIFFLPTGPIQELSLDSGWAEEFLVLADYFDRASGARCACLGHLKAETTFNEVSVLCCKKCGFRWVQHLSEDEAFSKSGRWTMAPIPKSESTPESEEEGKRFLGVQLLTLVGGSYFDGQLHLVSKVAG
jgi:hypothetical protein